MDKIVQSEKIRRLSLPVVSKDGSSDSRLNRRHTLIPGKGILKPNLDGNNTINIIPTEFTKESRRVSFAPEVTLHKINYAKGYEGRKLKRRSSLTGNIKEQTSNNADSKLTTSRYLGKIYESPISNKSMIHFSETDAQNSNRSNVPDQLVIDEETQTIEMSIELTNQIMRQQDVIKDQLTNNENLPLIPTTHSSLRDLFDEVDQELADTSEVAPNITTTGGVTSDENIEDNDDGETEFEEMEMTETVYLPKIDRLENQENLQTNIQLPTEVPTKDEIVGFHFLTEDEQTMEFTQPLKPIEHAKLNEVQENDETNNFSEMELTAPIMNNKPVTTDTSGPNNLFDDNDDETMEFTQPIRMTIENEKLEDSNVNTQLPETKSTEQIERPEENLETYNEEKLDFISVTTSHFRPETFDENTNIGGTNEETPNEETHNQNINSSVNYDKDTSEMETSLIGTEMIPLAEVTVDMTENGDTYESDNSFSDDNYINISLDVFLNDVNVQFFDNIGPSETEVGQTLDFNPESRSSITSSPSSAASSVTSTPSSISSAQRDPKSSISESIEACSNIPYYHYLVHLINQYKASIQSISTMVNTFSNDLLESNPTAIREYYQQNDDSKTDLCTNYQALATVTRKQTKLQNITFVSGLLEQLSISYERVNEALETELSKTVEWRKGVLIDRQKMIEKKMELDQELQKLNVLKDSFASIDMVKFLKNKAEVEQYEEKMESTSKKISTASQLLQEKNETIEQKKLIKQQLLEEIESLQSEITKATVPTKSDLDILTEKLSTLELEKGIKILDLTEKSFMFSDNLIVKFDPISDDDVSLTLSYKNIREFEPFAALANNFVVSNTRTIKQTEFTETLKTLVISWKKFVSLWADLLKIHYLHGCIIDEDNFKFKIEIKNDDNIYVKFDVDGTFEDLISDDVIPVRLTPSWSFGECIATDNLLQLLSKEITENNVISRLTLDSDA